MTTTQTSSRQSAAKAKRKPSRHARNGAKRTRSVRVDLSELVKLLHLDLGIDQDMPLTSDMPLYQVESILLLRSFLKKYEDATEPGAEEFAIKQFLERNARCEHWAYTWDHIFADEIMGEVKSILHTCIHGPDSCSTFSLSAIAEGFNVGPGASIGSEYGDFLTKVFHSGLSCANQDLYPFYRASLGRSTWAMAEKQRMAQYGLTLVSGSRLSTVPKKVNEKRVICTEPVLEMLFQKGIGALLERSLRRVFGIDISKQPDINRRLALIGSRTGRFGTSDLRGASDSVAVRACETVMPADLHRWLMRARSPCTTLPDGTVVKLHMVSSMGNAFTFPLQTMLFASIVVACYRALGIKPERCDSLDPNYGVFGDDIIVLSEAFELVNRALEAFGFAVNVDKSFNSGHFRESCGGDYWCGNLVRGIYIRHLSTVSDLNSAINRLIRWSARSCVDLDRTIGYLLRLLGRDLLYVPFAEGDTSGVKVPLEIARDSIRRDRATGAWRFRALVPVARSYPVPDIKDDWEVKGGRRRSYNGDAILTSLVGGFIRNGRVGLREESHTRYKVRWRISPNWDTVGAAEAEMLRGGDWKVAAARYLGNVGI